MKTLYQKTILIINQEYNMKLNTYDFNTFENYLYNLCLDYINNKAKQTGSCYDLVVSDQSADLFTKKLLTFYIKEDFELEFNTKKNKFLTKIKNINNLVIKDYVFRDYNSVEIKLENNAYFQDKIILSNGSVQNIHIYNKHLTTNIMSENILFSTQPHFFSFSKFEINNLDYIIKSNKRPVFDTLQNPYNNIEDSKAKFDIFLNQIKESFFESLSLKITTDEYGIKFSNILDNLNFLSEMKNLNLDLKRIILEKTGDIPKTSIFEDPFIKESIIGKKISEKSIKNDVINSIDMLSLTQDIDYSSFKELLTKKTNIVKPVLKNI